MDGRHIRTIPCKLAKPDQLFINKNADRPNPSVVGCPSSDVERRRYARPIAGFFDHPEWGVVLTANGVEWIATVGASGTGCQAAAEQEKSGNMA